MATECKLATAAVNASAAAVGALLNSGKIRIYDGTKPATANTAISDQVLLAELTFGNPAFGSPDEGVITAEAITQDSDANADGTPTWCRCLKSDNTPVMDGTAGYPSGFNLNLTTASIVQHAIVTCSSFTYTQPKEE